ncbi:MAG: ATP-binding domain-containing protein, partial [bacterium]|nr:ATP-binding domain-containing protein [bacterium]
RFYESFMENTFENAPARIEDVRQLAEFALQYESAAVFLSELALMGTVAAEVAAPGGEEGPDEAVVLSSVHQAKGLEWKSVFMIWLTDSRFPHARALGDAGGEEEERRLFYVALTRAKDELYLCQPMMESDTHRMTTFSRLSRFMAELPETLYERWTLDEDVIPAAGEGSAAIPGNTRPADPDEPDGLVYEYDEGF